jgi:hypothetical protein
MQIKLFCCCFLFPILIFSQNTSNENQNKHVKDIISQAIENIPENNPKTALDAFQYKKYTKGIIKTVDAETQAVAPAGGNYIFEVLALQQFDHHFEKTTVLGSNLPGFKKPDYRFFEKSFHSVSVYGNEYELLGLRFHSPLSKNGAKHYNYELVETVTTAQRPYHVIRFTPIKNSASTQISGELFLDTQSFAVQKAIISHSKNFEATITHNFTYFESEGIWFPSNTAAEVSLLNKLESINFFGNMVPAGRMRFQDDENTETSFSLISTHSEIELNTSEEIANNYVSVEALNKKNNDTTAFWSPYRENPLTDEELLIETAAQATVMTRNLENRVGRLTDFGNGYYRVGFFDVDLKVLFKYNVWEGVRLGVGGLTNERLSDRFRVGGYIVRALKQETFNYQITSNYLIFPETKTTLGATYTKDIQEMGDNPFLNSQRTYNLFEPRLVNITQFYRHKTIQTNLTHQINPRFNTEIQLSKSDVGQIIPYTYIKNGDALTDYSVVQAKAGISWTPFGQFMETPSGMTEYNLGFPRISAQVTQSFEGFLDGDFNFTKFDLKVDHQVKHINRSFTEVVFEGNLGFGDIPLTHAYHAYPNSPNKETIISRFSVAGNRSFETMYFGEFFSDKLASVQIKHQLRPWIISAKIKPEFVLITRHAIGDFSKQENHPDFTFNTLEKGYSESGFEINKIFWGFGLSFAYRYGAYHLPAFEDNVAFKFTFKLSL